MFYHRLFAYAVLGSICLMLPMGCGNRQGKVVTAAVPNAPVHPPVLIVSITPPACTFKTVRTFNSVPPAIQFEYPSGWLADKAQTAVFAIKSPSASAYSSLSLDIPKLPWHLPGMITLKMVANGYLEDLRKHQIRDAVVKEHCPLTLCNTQACRITSVGTENGAPSIDVAVIMIHADQVYILSGDSDQTGCDTARQALDAAVASIKWAKP